MSEASRSTGLLELYATHVEGTFGCFDRVVIIGTLVEVAHAGTINARLAHEGKKSSTSRSSPIRCAASCVIMPRRWLGRPGWRSSPSAAKNFRKDERVEAILKERGGHPRLVHVFSAMERSGAR